MVLFTVSSSHILSFTVTERPVFLSDLHQIDEYIFTPQRQTLVKTICYRFIKALFQFDGPPRLSVIWMNMQSLDRCIRDKWDQIGIRRPDAL